MMVNCPSTTVRHPPRIHEHAVLIAHVESNTVEHILFFKHISSYFIPGYAMGMCVYSKCSTVVPAALLRISKTQLQREKEREV